MSTNGYIPPAKVISPKTSWSLEKVLSDGGPRGPSYALGKWDGIPRIGFRWNGDDDNRLGNPQSRGLPTWTMLDEKLHRAVLALLPANEQSVGRKFLNLTIRFDTVSLHDTYVALVDLRDTPPFVAKLPCGTLSRFVGKVLNGEECRLLADVNRAALGDACEQVLLHRPGRVERANGFDVLDLMSVDLLGIKDRFSTEALKLSFSWAKI